MRQRAIARGGVRHAARMGLGVSHHLGNRLERRVRPHDQGHRHGPHHPDRHEVGRRVERQLRKHRLEGGEARRRHDQRVAIGGRLRGLRGPQGAAGAGLVVDDDGLAQYRLHGLGNLA